MVELHQKFVKQKGRESMPLYDFLANKKMKKP